MITIKRCYSADEVSPNIWGLFEEHREEVSTYKDIMKVNPRSDVYTNGFKDGSLVVLEAYNDEELSGYSISFVMKHPHYADLTVCSNDLLFVKKEFRNTRTGSLLMQETERHGVLMGAKMMLWHAKPDTSLSTILSRKAYRIQDIIFSKVL